MTEQTTIKEFEDRLKNERADLAALIGDFAERVGPDYVAGKLSDMLRDYAAPAARKAEAAVRANPVAFAVAGAGLAWLLLGRSSSDTAEPRPQTIARWEDEGGRPAPVGTQASDVALDDEWAQEIDRLRATASDRLHALEAEAAEKADDARDYVSERAHMVSDFASDLRAKLGAGLADLSDEARDKVLKAREAALSARLSAQDAAASAGRSGKQMAKDHPLIATALGIAIGAVIVKAMPKPDLTGTPLESHADRLLREARAIYAEEKARARDLAARVSGELRKTAAEASDQAVELGQDLSDRIARELAAEASRAAQNIGSHLRANGRAR
jgi:hypothetical protein